MITGYTRMPADLLQAGWPLKADLYRYTPIRKTLELCVKEGETLELDFLLEISMNPTILILVEEASLKRLRDGQSGNDLSEASEADAA